jgi:transcriptional regulator with XRE-family HTH domain
MIIHHGKTLKELCKEAQLTQEECADRFQYSRSGFRLLFKEERLKEDIISKAVEVFGVDRAVFYTESKVKPEPSGRIQELPACLSELVYIQSKLIQEQERNIKLQAELNELLKKNNSK